MTGTELKTMFEELVDDTLDEDLTYQIMNQAKDEIEAEREWEMLKKLDSSQTASTSEKTLPTDFLSPIILYIGNQPQYQVPFEQQHLFSNTSLRWVLKMATGKYQLLGSPTSGTLNFYYIYQTDDLTSGTSPVWPAKFHKLIPFKMAELYYAIDQGEKGLSWDDKWEKQYKMIHSLMVNWDANLKKRAVENAASTTDDVSIQLGDM